jgi:hypothetical protein
LNEEGAAWRHYLVVANVLLNPGGSSQRLRLQEAEFPPAKKRVEVSVGESVRMNLTSRSSMLACCKSFARFSHGGKNCEPEDIAACPAQGPGTPGIADEDVRRAYSGL